MEKAPAFQLNGRLLSLRDCEPRQSLLAWLQCQRLTGTKQGCADGDCGACTVALVGNGSNGEPHYQAVNSCLLPMGAMVGRAVLTVEALATVDKLHPVQQALVDCAGSQCGYCTPGFVMSLFVGHSHGALDDRTTEGNLCRCTGYGPIRRATAQLRDVPIANAATGGVIVADLENGRAPLANFFNPGCVDEALALKAAHPQAAWITGATDLGVSLSHGQAVAPALIALDRIAQLQELDIGNGHVRIGAAVSLSRLERELHGVFAALDQVLPWFAARQVRNRATLGGNLGSASPIGDLLPVLLALEAVIHCRGPDAERDIAAHEFFLDYRKTARQDDELVVAVTVPRRPTLHTASYKVAKRQTDDISIVVAAFALGLDGEGRIEHVRLAYGGVAAIPSRAKKTEHFLIGRRLDTDTTAHACALLTAEFTPLDDHRASADYRRQLCASLFAKFVAGYRS